MSRAGPGGDQKEISVYLAISERAVPNTRAVMCRRIAARD